MSLEILEKCNDPYINKKGIIYACGQCDHCRRQRSMEWVIRANHELLTEKNGALFITLSYSPKNLVVRAKKKQVPGDCRGTLVKRHEQLFKKRLRKFWEKDLGQKNKLRFILCGEYGTLRFRPHYHAIIYGANLTVLQNYISVNYNKVNSYKKWNGDKDLIDTLFGKIWGLGHVDVDRGEVHEHALQYVIGYIRKKIGNRFGGKEIYEDNGRTRPYMVTSQGIGRDWCDKNINSWTLTLKTGWKGKQVSIPRYYLKRVYKAEGETIKYSVYNHYTNEDIVKYKVLKNMSGKYTQKIFRTRLENQKKQLQGIKERRPELYERTQKYFINLNEMTANFIMKDIRLQEQLQKDRIGTLQKIQEKYTEEKDKERRILMKFGGKKPKRKSFEKIINERIERKKLLGQEINEIDKFNISAIKKAKLNNEKIKNGFYGRREKYETIEMINNEKIRLEEENEENLYFTPFFDWELKEKEKKFKKTLDNIKLEFYKTYRDDLAYNKLRPRKK